MKAEIFTCLLFHVNQQMSLNMVGSFLRIVGFNNAPGSSFQIFKNFCSLCVILQLSKVCGLVLSFLAEFLTSYVCFSKNHLEKEFVLDFFCYYFLQSILTLHSAFSFPVFICSVFVLGKYNGKEKEKKVDNYSSSPFLFVSVTRFLSLITAPSYTVWHGLLPHIFSFMCGNGRCNTALQLRNAGYLRVLVLL